MAASFVLAVFQIHNDDAFFHIATGRWILAHGHVPLRNPFSYAEDGAVWVQHQWLPAVAIAWIADNLGLEALVYAKAAVVAAIFGGLALHMRRGRVPAGVGALLLAAGVAGSAFRFYERPYLASAAALAVVATLLARQAGRRLPGWGALLGAAGVTAAAWQLHAGALHSVLAWCAFVGGATLRWAASRRGASAARGGGAAGGGGDARPAAALRRAWGGFGIALGLSVGGLWLLAPSGLSVMTLPVRFSADAYWNVHLAEFRPLRLSWMYGPQWLAVGAAAVVCALAVRARRWDALLLVAGFAVLGVKHQRLVWVMVIATLSAAGALPWPPPLRARLSRPALRLAMGLACAALLLGAWLDQSSWFRMGTGEDGLDHRRHPVALLRLAARLPAETFVSDGLAGTWLWLSYAEQTPDGAPIEPEGRHRVLVHNCLECYEASTYIDLYQHIRYALPGWEDKVARLGIRSFVLKHTTAGERRLQGGRPNVRQRLFADPRWVLVDFDDVASIYVARGGLPPGVRALDPFPVDPDTGRARPGAERGEILRALIDHARSHPGGVRSLDMAARRAWRRGSEALALALQAEVRRRDDGGRTAEQLAALMGRAPVAGPGTLGRLREKLAATGWGGR